MTSTRALLLVSWALCSCTLLLSLRSRDACNEKNFQASCASEESILRCVEGVVFEVQCEGLCDPDVSICALCGDGITSPGEPCDDANSIEGDECDSNCTIPSCNNQITSPGELCLGAPSAIFLDATPSSATLGDIDNDQDLDLLAVSAAASPSKNIFIFENDSAGGFTSKITLRIGKELSDLALGDFDNDQDLDLAVSSPGDNRVYLFENPGDGLFSEIKGLPTGEDIPASLATGDLDNDGDQDLVIGHLGCTDSPGFICQVSLFFFEGEPTTPQEIVLLPIGFLRVQNKIALAELSGDTQLDLVLTSPQTHELGVFIGAGGDFTNQPNFILLDSPSIAFALADLNGDSLLDIPSFGNNPLLLLNEGGGVFTNSGDFQFFAAEEASDIAADDLTNDAESELIISYIQTSRVSILRKDEFLGLQEEESISLLNSGGQGPIRVLTGALNLDQAPDLVVVNAESNTLTVILSAP